MQLFIHCNFFCQEYKFTYLLTYLCATLSPTKSNKTSYIAIAPIALNLTNSNSITLTLEKSS